MADPVGETTARNRWMIISVLRLAGVAMVVCGILVQQAIIPAPPAAGLALLFAGLLDTFVVPLLLARRWRTPRQ